MASAVDKQPAAARLAAVAAAGCLPTATNGRQNSYTTPGDTTGKAHEADQDMRKYVTVQRHLLQLDRRGLAPDPEFDGE